MSALHNGTESWREIISVNHVHNFWNTGTSVFESIHILGYRISRMTTQNGNHSMQMPFSNHSISWLKVHLCYAAHEGNHSDSRLQVHNEIHNVIRHHRISQSGSWHAGRQAKWLLVSAGKHEHMDIKWQILHVTASGSLVSGRSDDVWNQYQTTQSVKKTKAKSKLRTNT